MLENWEIKLGVCYNKNEAYLPSVKKVRIDAPLGALVCFKCLQCSIKSAKISVPPYLVGLAP
jgi:hypothetical protein